MQISLIGSGNVAWHLASVFVEKGNSIAEIYSRSLVNAQALSSELGAGVAQDHLDFSQSLSKLFVIAVKDDAIAEVVENLKLPKDALLVHTSGSQSIEILNQAQEKGIEIGVFYPLQTFSKAKKVDFSQIPICIESSHSASLDLLKQLAQSLTVHVLEINSKQRKRIHLAAVFACNFSNHLWAIASELLQYEGLSLALLKPLILETLEKAFEIQPKPAQTGPARRHDFQTLSEHFKSLDEFPIWKQVYQVMSASIQEMYPLGK
jgi:predicted short-subunit dehydrogenase-like oxidoreductase (DUF2520 family)